MNGSNVVRFDVCKKLEELHGYLHIQGEQLTPEYGERKSYESFMLEPRLEKSLKRLNPWMDSESIAAAIKRIESPREDKNISLDALNESMYDIIVNQIINIEARDESDKLVQRKVEFIDFENVENNEFVATDGFKITSEGKITEYDTIIFINGLPMVMVEKRKSSNNIITDEWIYKMDVYKRLVAELYSSRGISSCSMLCIIMTRDNAYVGTVTDRCVNFKRFCALADVDEFFEPLEKGMLVNIIKNHIWYEYDLKSGNRRKRVCSFRHIKTVDRLFENAASSKNTLAHSFCGTDNGIIATHTLLRMTNSSTFRRFRICVLTKRSDIKKRVERSIPLSKENIRLIRKFGEFVRTCTDSADEHTCVAVSDGADVNVETFVKPYADEISEVGNVVFIFDSLDEFADKAKQLRRYFPKGIFLSVSDVPRELLDEELSGIFGEYACSYDAASALEYGAIVKTLVRDSGDYKILLLEDKIQKVFGHYMSVIYPQESKACILCENEQEAHKYFKTIRRMISELPGCDVTVKELGSSMSDIEKANILKDFKEPLKIDKTGILVTDQVIPGYIEQPHLAIVYCDKVLDESKDILRAVTMGSSEYAYKEFFMFFDISREASSRWILNVVGKYGDFAVPYDVVYKELKAAREEIKAVLEGADLGEVDKVIKIMDSEIKRADFEKAYRSYAALVEQITGEYDSPEYEEYLKKLSFLRAQIKAAFSPKGNLDMDFLGRSTRRLLSDYASQSQLYEIMTPISIYDGNFARKMSMLGNAARAYSMENAIRAAIELNIGKNMELHDRLLRKLEMILVDTHDNWIKRVQQLEGFLKEDFEDEMLRARKLGVPLQALQVLDIISHWIDSTEEEMLDMAVNINIGISILVEKNFVPKWTIKEELIGVIKEGIKNIVVSRYGNRFKKESIPILTNQLYEFTVRNYSTLENIVEVKEISIEEFIKGDKK